MLLKKKLCICALLCGVLFFMIASHTVQRNSSLPVTVEVSQTTVNTPGTTLPKSRVVTEPNQRLCSCPSCVTDPGDSEWFNKRYDSKQRPYLTTMENQIDPLSLKWWMALQQSVNGTIEEVIKKMFTVISSPPLEDTHQSSQCRKCAVVGNSGNLLRTKFGALIDSHTFVFRMNKATTFGFEQDVGTKTTHHFMYPESAMDLAPGVHLVLLPFKLRDLEWVTSALSTGEVKRTYIRVKEFVQADKDKVIVVSPSFFKYTHDQWTERHGRYPSTGMLAIVFALHLCDEVSVFGYGADSQGNWHHYWEYNKYAGAFRKTGVHNADFEHDVIVKLDKEGKIKLYPMAGQ